MKELLTNTHVVPVTKRWSVKDFVMTYMSTVPVKEITAGLCLEVAEYLLKSPKISQYRKIQIAESVYQYATNLDTVQNISIYQHVWAALKVAGTAEQKNDFRIAINIANQSNRFVGSYTHS